MTTTPAAANIIAPERPFFLGAGMNVAGLIPGFSIRGGGGIAGTVDMPKGESCGGSADGPSNITSAGTAGFGGGAGAGKASPVKGSFSRTGVGPLPETGPSSNGCGGFE